MRILAALIALMLIAVIAGSATAQEEATAQENDALSTMRRSKPPIDTGNPGGPPAMHRPGINTGNPGGPPVMAAPEAPSPLIKPEDARGTEPYQAEKADGRAPADALPALASPMPLVALIGFLCLLTAFLLRFRLRRKPHD
jgi:hypothetical protein